MTRQLKSAGLDLIKNYEGCRLTAYNTTGKEQHLTIGWGHYGPDVKPGMKITQVDADNILVKDLARYEAYVNNPAYVPLTAQLTQNQFDALVSFTYNCGQGNLQSLCRAGRNLQDIAAAMPAYNKAGGVVLAGLVKRRAAEVELFNKEDSVLEKISVYVDGKKLVDGLYDDKVGITYVPVRSIAESFGVSVKWDNKQKRVDLTKR